jgi:hypothetical protein
MTAAKQSSPSHRKCIKLPTMKSPCVCLAIFGLVMAGCVDRVKQPAPEFSAQASHPTQLLFCDPSEAEYEMIVTLSAPPMITSEIQSLYFRQRRDALELQTPLLNKAKWSKSEIYNPGGGPGYVEIVHCEAVFSVSGDSITGVLSTIITGHQDHVRLSEEISLPVNKSFTATFARAKIHVEWKSLRPNLQSSP